ncbi:MAG: MFS transporter [Methanomicrobiales archaeon]|nr:MFS transporter [Methanomicrobiales archaeon]
MVTAGAVTSRHGFTLLLISISLAAFMTALDGTIVNIALPTISEAFDVSTSMVSWVSTIYLLVISGCILIFGKVSDQIGFRKVFLWGFLLFSAGSLFCGLLPNLLGSFPVLIGSRAFQAVGAAMIAAIGPAMVTAYFPMEQKGKAMGIVLTFSSIGTIVGPAIGGVVCQYLSWNWIFFINIPVGIIAILLGAKVIPMTGVVKRTGGFDRAGSALIFVGLASLLFALSEGETFGWTTPAIIVAFALAVLTLGGFIYCELRSQDPLLELRLFTRRNFLMTNMIIALIFFCYGGLNYLLPFYLEYVHHDVPSAAGLILSSLSVAGGIAGILAGMLYNRTGGRLLCIFAGISIAAGFLMLTLIRVDTSTGFVILCLLLFGFGMGLMLTPVSNMIMNSVARKYQGMVSGLIIVERFAPMSMGIALFNLVFIQGAITVATHNEITQMAPVNIRIETLMTGFDLAFFFALLVGIIVLILAIVARQETHPDYQQGG